MRKQIETYVGTDYTQGLHQGGFTTYGTQAFDTLEQAIEWYKADTDRSVALYYRCSECVTDQVTGGGILCAECNADFEATQAEAEAAGK